MKKVVVTTAKAPTRATSANGLTLAIKKFPKGGNTPQMLQIEVKEIQCYITGGYLVVVICSKASYTY